MDKPEVWKEIRDRDGSVQDLDFLTDHEKEVFKTYSEIDQLAICESNFFSSNALTAF